MSIAKTILEQIKTIDPRATWAWGAKDFVNTGHGLQFKTSGMVKNKCYVLVKLNGSDLYDLEFFKVRAGKLAVIKNVTDVYAEDLVNEIDVVVQ